MEITKFDHNLKKIIVTIKFNDPIIDIMKFLIYEKKKLQNLQKMMNDINMLIMVDILFILFLVLDKINFLILKRINKIINYNIFFVFLHFLTSLSYILFLYLFHSHFSINIYFIYSFNSFFREEKY